MSTLRVEAQKQSNRNNELQVHLDDMEDLLLSDRTKLRAEIANLLKEKLEMEETAQRLERTARAQEPNIEIVTENNLKLMKDKLEIEETVKRLEKTLSAYEEYIKITHQTVCCTLVFTENLKAVNNASSLINEIKSFMEKIGSIRQNAEVVDEDFKDLNFSFTETKNSFLVNKDTDKRDSKTVAMDEDGIKIIEEPPPSATRKAPTRSAAVAEKRSLSVQKENEHSSRTSSNEPTDINNEAYAIRGRQKLVPSPPCNFPMPMLILEDCLRVRQNPKTARARKDESQISDDDSYSFTATPFLSAKQNDAPEYLSMNARTCQTNPNPVIPLSVPPAKKCRNK
ncbi:uncharacterized protein LOC124197465 [Daphnia pulex]|uniref:uncharacterized protein LOC124197465 n=1 Tax=Daphnia pulex TaxID=6669 RepID=UPI001EDD75D7|nr:uncharacterized protein LOC124197465 [Daphnia pulex]XP_046448920.1 uncharacterized protein LOC124197465 [Daphnia pulex]XP_046448928.1 uncharacterized protein LOC124197465 [Daphnia pulex]XP_046448938.1 uncharacterized protein LOC124197465 [Daphnia pulex]XP_046448946.1 uncharacterized protein LOC124197465 [Daphnia pulex]XP_046448953.1 uncharacterized protein LOC124197465 [Daphnia pulex]